MLTTPDVEGIKIFTVIDQASEAKAVGLDMPLKLLVTQDAGGQSFVSYMAPDRLRTRHDLPATLAPVLEAVETLAAAVSGVG
jgi:uncharacterized protein (DUF302 family)